MDVHVYHNVVSNRFEVNTNEGLCRLEYDKIGTNILEYKRTYVPEQIRHQGIGHKLVGQALEYAKEQQYYVKPTCSFVRNVAREDDRYENVIV